MVSWSNYLPGNLNAGKKKLFKKVKYQSCNLWKLSEMFLIIKKRNQPDEGIENYKQYKCTEKGWRPAGKFIKQVDQQKIQQQMNDKCSGYSHYYFIKMA
jgi:hypothetical protein